MSEARAHILATIKTALGRNRLNPEARRVLEDRLADPKANVIPARAKIGPNGAHKDLIERFLEETGRADATAERLADLAAVPGAVARFLAAAGLPGRIKAMPDPVLRTLSWTSPGTAPGFTVAYGPASPEDTAGLALAAAGIAETGTLMLVSGPERPVTINFLPETALVVLFAGTIVGAYEDAWKMLRDRAVGGRPFMPRAVNLITGPSRTADIEQTLLLGAHGPQRLHILVIDDAATA
ncbi:MAG: lactate utilization protein [Rhodospirillales bacterium]